MLKYRVIVCKGRTEYGIALSENGLDIAEIPQISSCRRDIERLTALLNEEQVEPCHFEDVVEDYLTDFSL